MKTGIIGKDSGKFFTKLFAMRQNADYEDEVEYDKEDVLPLIEPAKELIATIEAILSKA